jgi:ArsR family transcriptional regulator, zinc-responsive transcriptional repressor
MSSEEELEQMDFSYLERVADCLRLMAHPIRIRMVELLSQKLFSVGELAELCKIPHNQACEHLRLLKNHGLLSSKRNGRMVYYSIESTQVMGLLTCIKSNCPGK